MKTKIEDLPSPHNVQHLIRAVSFFAVVDDRD